MTTPAPNLCCFLEGHPIQLLYRVSKSRVGDTWHVRDIFTATAEAPEHDVVIRPSDRLTPIHGRQT